MLCMYANVSAEMWMENNGVHILGIRYAGHINNLFK